MEIILNTESALVCDDSVATTAYRNYCKYFGLRSDGGYGDRFWAFVGDPDVKLQIIDTGPLNWVFTNPKAPERVTALAGPHWRTMIKVIEARNEQETQNQLSATA